MEQRTVTIKNFLRITKIVQVSAMKVHFQIAERSLFYLNPDIHYRRMTYPPERVMILSKGRNYKSLYSRGCKISTSLTETSASVQDSFIL